MMEFLSNLDPIALYGAVVATLVAVVEIIRWKREQASVFALLTVDPPHDAQIYWDRKTLQFVFFDRNASKPVPGLELGITNIGSGTARNITVHFCFEYINLAELVAR